MYLSFVTKFLSNGDVTINKIKLLQTGKYVYIVSVFVLWIPALVYFKYVVVAFEYTERALPVLLLVTN